MKKLLAILLTLSILISLTACKITKDPDSFLNGVNLEEYSIVYSADAPDYNKRAAEYIAEQIEARANLKLTVSTDDAAEQKYEIVVGETNRAISAELNAEAEPLEFAIFEKDGKIALEADYFVIAAAAYFFIDTYVPNDGYEATIPAGISIHAPIVREAKNFIMLIGDGMGVNQTLLFDYLTDTTDYSDGEDVFYGYMFPSHGFSMTNSLSGVTDSAAGGTALSTGYKTKNNYLGMLPDETVLTSLTELAISLGMSTAVHSTEDQTGATPSSFSAHNVNRNNSSEIRTEQFALKQSAGTIIECNFDYYTDRYMNNVIEPLILDTLGKLDDNEKGFFLMYEEAHIDKHSHKNDMQKTFEALIRFNQVIARYMEYAFYNPDTFILITADHETGGLYADTEGGALSYHTESHTSTNVPIFAYGAGSELFDGKTMENTEIPKIIASLMGVDNFGDQNS